MKYYSLYDPLTQEWSELIPAKSVDSIVLSIAQNPPAGYSETELSLFRLRHVLTTSYTEKGILSVKLADSDPFLIGDEIVERIRLLKQAP